MKIIKETDFKNEPEKIIKFKKGNNPSTLIKRIAR